MIETDFSSSSTEFEDQNDFLTEEAAEQYKATATGTFTDDQIARLRKREVKTDVASAIISVGISSIPMIYSYFKSKKSPVKYQPTGKDFARIGLFNLIPIIKVVDSALLNGKISNLIAEKTSFKFNDVRNVVSLCYAYKPFYNVLMGSLENSNRRMSNEQVLPKNKYDILNAWLSGINLVAPYVVYKFTDENMSFSQKCSSIVPIGVLGSWVRKLCMTNPKAQQAYDVAGSLVKVVSLGNNSLSSAIRPQQGSALNKGSTAINNVLNIASDLMGVNRGSFSTYGYNGYNSGWGSPNTKWAY